MRLLLFAAAVALLGCGKGGAPAAAGVQAPPADPVAARREEDAEAAYSLDTALASIADALDATKRLAPVAGGDAKEALLDVAEMLDSAGATLADHDEPPPPLAEYRKAEAERSSERRRALNDALDALHELRDAQGTLDDLTQTAPPDRQDALGGIGAGTDDAIGSVENAIVRLGGKVPKEEGVGL